jgi:hypothetical protein
MSAIAPANSYTSDIAAALLANSDGTSQSSPSEPAALAATSDAGSSNGRDPATRVDLSDKVKDILARAGNDQDVADRLKAFVESHRLRNTDGSSQGGASSSHGSTADVNKGFEQLSGGTSTSDDSGDYQPVQVAKNFATGLRADGYSISAVGRASDGSFQIAIVGPDGTGFLDRRFGTSGEFAGFSNLGPGQAAQEYQRGNKEYITFSESEAAATSVTASSDAGSVSATSSATHTASVTFVVDFSTGGISMLRSESTSVSTAVQIRQPGSAFSAPA